MMNLRALIRPSAKIEDSQERSQAEVLSGLLVSRLITFLLNIVVLAGHNSQLVSVMIGVITINFAAYIISRTRYFKWAAVIIVAEPLIMIPLQPTGHLNELNETIFVPLWLSFGPLISSLVFKTRTTLAVIGLTLVAFFVIWLKADVSVSGLLYNEVLFTLGIATLALIGSHLRDVSDQTLAEERAKVLHSSKLAALGEMAAGIAHELNSPLGAITLGSELISDLSDSPNPPLDQIREESLAILETAERMSQIIKGLKTFSRDSKNDAKASLPASAWVNDCLKLCQKRFDSCSIKLEVDIESLNVATLVQPIELTQVLMNLLNNAFDAVITADEKWVKVTGKISGSHFELSVTDSGRGIPSSVAAKMFNPFYTTKDFGQGTGLGLSISRGILKSHDGDLKFDASSVNTRFIILLPLPSADLAAA